MKADISNSGSQQSQFNETDRRNRVNTNARKKTWNGIKDLAEVKDQVRAQHTEDEIKEFTDIYDLGDGKTVVVYTEDIALHNRLRNWDQCLIELAYVKIELACVEQGPEPLCQYERIGFELYFPKRMMREFRYCGIASAKGTTGCRSCTTPLGRAEKLAAFDLSDMLWDVLERQASNRQNNAF